MLAVTIVLISVYVLLRNRGHRSETDTFVFTRRINGIISEESLVTIPAYPNGYAFQSLASFLVITTGLNTASFQLFGGSLLAIIVIIPAYLLYRQFTSSENTAFVATLILMIQPEFLFPILRGTHEKFTRALMMLSLYLVIRSIRLRSRFSVFVSLVLAFYLVAFAQIAFNSFFADSYLIAFAIALGLLIVAARNIPTEESYIDQSLLRRLVLITLTLLVLTFLFIFYLYTPARNQLFELKFIGDRLAALLLDVEAGSINNPYQYTGGAWVSLPIYFLVSAATWILFISSALIWLHKTGQILFRHNIPFDQPSLILWALYGGFAIIGFISIIIDLTGSLASNLQVRAFPSFVILAAPLIAGSLSRYFQAKVRLPSLARYALIVSLVFLLVLSTLKAVNDPFVSNKWSFYIPAESQSIDWADQYMAGAESLWLSFDERLVVRMDEADHFDNRIIVFDTGERDLATRDLLISSINTARAERLGESLPIEGDSLITYDNGDSQIYHLRPRNPFQR